MITYPIFGQDRDKWMFMIDSESGLNYLEAIDIEGKEYIGWDVRGIPIDFYLDNEEIKVRSLSEEPQVERLKQAILDYAATARPKVPFNPSGLEDNVIGLFKAVEEHVERGSLRRKIRRFFGNE